MQQRRGTAAQWTAANPILAAGEIGFETDTSKFKMGNGSSTWSALQYFANAAELAAIIDSAPGTMDTLNELAAALGDDPAFFTTTANNLALKAPINNPTFTGTVGGVTKSMVGLGNVDNTTDANKPVSTAAQEALDLKAPLASPSLTGVPTAPTASSLTNTTQIATTEFVQTKVNNLVNGAPGLLDTLDELAAALGNNENFASELTNTLALKASLTNLSDHNSSTENVHGIADTSLLVTDAGLAEALTDAIEAHNDLTTNVHGIADTAELATAADIVAANSAASTALGLHADATTSVHGIADTSLLVTVSDLEDALDEASVDQSALAGTGIDWNAAELRFDIDATIATTAYADQAEADAITAAGTAADTKISTAVAALTKSSVGLGNVDNTSDANKPVSTATQTALDLKSPLASPTFTGTVTTGHVLPATDITFDLGSPTKMWRDIYVGPGSLYVNGQKVLQTDAGDVVITADANENLALRTSGSGNIELDPTGAGSVNIKGPLVVEAGANFSSNDGNGIAFSNGIKADSVSSNTLNTDLSLSGNGTGKVYLNDNAEVNGNLVVGGNLTVSGTTTTVNSETISLADNIIDLNSNFTTGTPTENAGIKIKRGDSSDVQLRWNESTDSWEFTNDGTAYSAIAGLSSPTFTGTVAGITKSMVGLGNVDNTTDANKPISTATQTALDLKANLASPTLATPTITGALTLSASGVAFTDGTQTKAGVPSLTTITQKSAGYTLGALTDRDSMIEFSQAAVVTIPTDATLNFPIGTSIDILQTGTGAVSIAAATPGTTAVNATPGLTLRGQWSSATLLKRAANAWVVFGDLK